MATWLVVGFFGMMLIYVLVVARILAETGVPLGFCIATAYGESLNAWFAILVA